MTANEIRKKFLDFFKEKGHTIIPSASLIPENDPTVLFTTAGMHPLVPYLLGEPHPSGKLLANAQKCIRTTDIDEVGDNSHLTFFEMLGNWSLGDYFKKETLGWSFEFLTSPQWLGIDAKKLAVSVFKGDENAPRDDESAEVWKKVGISPDKIVYLPKEKNWWGPAGEIGPCGPDTEIFHWRGVGDSPPESSNPETDEENWLEIWNDVFMQYNRKIKYQKSNIKNDAFSNSDIQEDLYEYEPLAQKNVDTGMGLERITAVLQGAKTVYDTELFKPIFGKLFEITGRDYYKENNGENKRAMRIIADHLKATVFIIGDERGVVPSNIGQGYVARRLIRRVIRYIHLLNKETISLIPLIESVITIYKDVYPEILKNKERIIKEISIEEEKFGRTLKQGLVELRKLVEEKEELSPKDAFNLYQTYGFPLEMINEELGDRALSIDKKEFDEEFKKHQEISREGAEQKFAGGLADHSVESMRYHTATHLLHQALRLTLGEHVFQKGSNITRERLRFDFSHSKKMTQEEIKEKYAQIGEKIKVYFIGEEGLVPRSLGEGGDYFSKEVCGGPHMENTRELGAFKIIKEEAVSAGVRRIKAVLE
ncbi:MAG: alanine--tRNA ligase [Parcubacteria group bacterium]|nr:alanine--tRNA ligase [Parcubacteria group bacterium]